MPQQRRGFLFALDPWGSQKVCATKVCVCVWVCVCVCLSCFGKESYTSCACRALMVRKQGFAQGQVLRVCGEFFRGCIEFAVPAEQGVAFALRKFHHQGPFMLAMHNIDQWCHKGVHLRVPVVLPEECFGGRFTVCLECIVFQRFHLRAAGRATLTADNKGGRRRRLTRPSAILLANAASRTVLNQPKIPRPHLATRTCAQSHSKGQQKMINFFAIYGGGCRPTWNGLKILSLDRPFQIHFRILKRRFSATFGLTLIFRDSRGMGRVNTHMASLVLQD